MRPNLSVESALPTKRTNKLTHESDDVSLQETELVVSTGQIGVQRPGELCVPPWTSVRDRH
jgi:hypothetical protein